MQGEIEHGYGVILNQYFNKINKMNPTGLELIGRILSCISILRNVEKRFFVPGDPSEYTADIFKAEHDFINHIKQLGDILEVNSIDRQMAEKHRSQDDLHIYLFDKTWQTLKFSGDPLNEYKPYIELIEKRMNKNGLDKVFFRNKQCLDVGCGTGRFSIVMRQLGGVVDGIDPGQSSIKHAQKLVKRLGISNITYTVGNAYDIPFDDNNFDFVVCNGVLHHLDHPDEALKEIYRVLKPGGLFWLYIEGSGGLYHDLWDGIHASFVDTSLSEVFELLEHLRISNIHFWMDIFFAKYYFVSYQENENRLKKIGFRNVRRMQGAEKQDIALEMFNEDAYRNIKFGDGGIRVLAQK